MTKKQKAPKQPRPPTAEEAGRFMDDLLAARRKYWAEKVAQQAPAVQRELFDKRKAS